MKGIGLVFAGGGGKGAYEIGVWKYMHEIGIDQYVRAVSGTSVGALNAALFAGSSYEIAERLWLNIQPDLILTPRKITPDEILLFLTKTGLSMSGPIGRTLGKTSSVFISKVSIATEVLAHQIMKKIQSDYLFSRNGLIQLIKGGVNFNELKNGISCYATCLRLPMFQIDRFRLNDFNEKDIISILLASSAIPLIFQNEKIKEYSYCDGGIPIVGDNIPIMPVYETGVEYIFVVHLNRDTVIDVDKFKDSQIIEIVPGIDLGNALTGTLDFTADGAEKRIRQGYKDAEKVLQPMLKMIMLGAENQILLKSAEEKMKEFEIKKNKLVERQKSIQKEMETDGFYDLYNELERKN